MFPNATHVEIGGRAIVYQVQGDAVIFQFGDGSYTEQERAMVRDHVSNAISFKLPDINAIMRTHSLAQSIRTLPRAEAVFNDYQNKKKAGLCFKGTREALLREMADWTTSSSEARMYVLSGLAGIGKSTVAYTIATRTADLGLLGASFFFSRDEADRNHAKRFFTTIAYQLCVYDKAFANAVGEVLLTERGSAAITKDPQEQLQVLIVEPLRSIIQSRIRPILVVVDGLDECNEDDVHGVVIGLSQLVQLLPSFKVILTTRPRPLVDYLFCDQDGQCHKIFHLQDIENKVVDGDIRSYLSYSLSLKQVRACLRNPKEQWCADDEEIDHLVRAAGRLFIIASTAVLYLLNRTLGDPGSRMKKLLSEIAHDRTPFHALNHFYSIILRSAIPIDDDDDDIQDRYQNVVGTITFIQIPLPVTTLTCFMGEESEKVYAMLRNLQSVILLGNDDVPRIYHKSFSDYVTDPARCKDSHLLINSRTRHTLIAIRCFEIMDKHLKYNILNLSVPAQFMSNEDGLGEDGITDEKLQEKIPQELRYACVHWTNHVVFANIEKGDVMNGLATFVEEHILHWIEILSLIGKLDSAHAIRVVLKLLSQSSDLHQILSDALRLISKFYELIEGSALHTYHSALPFAPTESLLYRRYMKKTGYNGFGIVGGPEKWDSLIASRNHGEPVDIVKFSLNSTLFLSCNEEYVSDRYNVHFQGRLKIWDATTGTPISTITGQNFAIAKDFSTIVSSEINTIMFYNMNGTPQNVMLTTQSNVEQLALSSEVSRVAARLSDGSIWLWDSKNAELINNFNEFEEESAQLQFSPAGTRLIYRSMNGVIKLRDGISGKLIADMAVDSWGDHCVVYSNDGSRIASLSSNYSLALWDSESGRLIGAVWAGHDSYDLGLAISANGSILAVSDRTNVKLWSGGNTLSLFAVLNESSQSLAISLDNILAVTTDSGTIKLYHIEAQSFISTLSFIGWARSLAFSQDCTRLAVGNAKDTVYIWDIQGIKASSDSSTREQSTHRSITALAFSRNGLRLAYGLEDGTVELWETNPTERRIATHQAHEIGVGMLGFVPDGGLFASVSGESTVKLWNGGDGSLRGTFESPSSSFAVALSNSMIAVARDCGVTLRTLDTLNCIHTFDEQDRIQFVSISDDSSIVAVVFDFNCIRLFDTMNRTTIAIFNVPHWIRTLTFLPDNSQVVIQCNDGDLYSFNLISKEVIDGPISKHLIQLPNVPLWCGRPIWYRKNNNRQEQHLAALFSQDISNAVAVLFIPNDYDVTQSYLGLSMIALRCQDGCVLRVRPPANLASDCHYT